MWLASGISVCAPKKLIAIGLSYIFFHGKRHPRELDAEAVRAFLTHLAVND